jgi:hypothetical protein
MLNWHTESNDTNVAMGVITLVLEHLLDQADRAEAVAVQDELVAEQLLDDVGTLEMELATRKMMADARQKEIRAICKALIAEHGETAFGDYTAPDEEITGIFDFEDIGSEWSLSHDVNTTVVAPPIESSDRLALDETMREVMSGIDDLFIGHTADTLNWF